MIELHKNMVRGTLPELAELVLASATEERLHIFEQTVEDQHMLIVANMLHCVAVFVEERVQELFAGLTTSEAFATLMIPVAHRKTRIQEIADTRNRSLSVHKQLASILYRIACFRVEEVRAKLYTLLAEACSSQAMQEIHDVQHEKRHFHEQLPLLINVVMDIPIA